MLKGPQLLNRSDIKIGDRFRKDYGNMADFIDSVREKGMIQPVTVDQDGNLLAGGRRMRAAEELQLEQIPALVRHVTDQADALEIELFENIHRKELTWQEEARLTKAIHELHGASQRGTAELLNRSVGGVNRKLAIASALEALPELAKLKTEDDAVKVVKKIEEQAILKELARRQKEKMPEATNLLRYADHHYRINDFFDAIKEWPDNSPFVKLIEVDPPYGINLKASKRKEGVANLNLDVYNEVDGFAYPDFLEKVARECYRVANQDSWMIFWYGPTWVTEVKDALIMAGWTIDDIPGIWVKGETGQTMQPKVNLARCYEPFFICRKGQAFLFKEGRSNVFTFPPVAGAKKIHPTERPLDLMMELLSVFLPPKAGPSMGVLVPFAGSGVTIRAAYRYGCSATGYDLCEEYKVKFLQEVQNDSLALIEKGDSHE